MSCGSNVTINHQIMGYGMGGPPILSTPSSLTFTVTSWENDQEDLFIQAEVYFVKLNVFLFQFSKHLIY